MSSSRDELHARLATIRAGIADAAGRAGRDASDVKLVAAAKGTSPRAVGWVVEAGVDAIGHNYVQELKACREALDGVAARWHYIGTLQSGAANQVADFSDVVETVAGERAARRLGRRASAAGRVLDVLIEVDLTESRTGVPPAAAEGFADTVASIAGLRLCGLMTLPPIPEVPEDARPWFGALRSLRDRLREKHPEVLELSMGMSLDYRVAVEEGATMVRIGTALFGSRTP